MIVSTTTKEILSCCSNLLVNVWWRSLRLEGLIINNFEASFSPKIWVILSTDKPSVSTNNTTFINKNKIYTDFGARIFDLGSDLSYLEVKIYNANNIFIRGKNFNLFQENIREYNLYDNSILLTENETALDISYVIRYIVSDKADNITSLDRIIDYKKIINTFEYTIILRFYNVIDISLNDEFNSNLNIKKTENLIKWFWV